MTNTKPSKTERQSNEQLKGNLGQKEAQLEKEKDLISLTWVRNPAKPIKNRVEGYKKAVAAATVDWRSRGQA